MASTIAAVTTSGGGVVTTADATGELNLLAGTTTVVALTATGAAVTGTLSNTTGANFATSSGNVGIGTSSPAVKLHVYSTASDGANMRLQSTGGSIVAKMINNDNGYKAWVGNDGTNDQWAVGQWGLTGANLGFYTGSGLTERMRIDSSGNVGIGTTSPSSLLNVVSTSSSGVSTGVFSNANNSLFIRNGGGTIAYLTSDSSVNNAWGMDSTSNYVAAYTGNGTERMRIDSSGNLLVGATATSNGGKFLVAQPTAASQSAVFQSTNATAGNNYGVYIVYTASAPNGTSNNFLECDDNVQARASIRSNGGLANFSANNVNLSDARTKTDIQDAGSYLAKICAIPVRTFKYKDQTDDLLNLGCIAQEVETVAPELVDVSGFGKTPDDGIPLKAIYQTDLQYALMKCIQEQQALITALTDRIAALEAK